MSTIAIYCLPLATATIVINIYPLLIPIIAYVVLKEKLRFIEIIGLFVCFGGIIMVNASGGPEEETIDRDFGAWKRIIGIMSAVFTAVGIATLSVLTRKLKKLHFTVVGLWYAVIGSLVFGLGYLWRGIFEEGYAQIFGGRMYLLCFLGGCCNVSSQMCQIKGLQVQPAGRAGLIANLQVFWAFLIDITYFAEAIRPMELCGSMLIFAVVTGLALINYFSKS